jgi:citrate lyase subunit gamma (acyl carrier protein)
MQLKTPAIAGTLESSDVQITLRPNPGMGIQIDLQSNVKALFGDAIEATVRDVLAEFNVSDALVDVNDKGALDLVIRARTQCAVCRSAHLPFDWGKEDPNGKA